jgi:hypothetical protein
MRVFAMPVSSQMTEPLKVAAFFGSVWRDFRHSRYLLVIYEVAFKLAEAWLLVPAVALLLAVVLSRAGHTAVSNLDIMDFLLTPYGLFYAAILGTIAMALWLVEQAGVMVLVAPTGGKERSSLGQMPAKLSMQLWPITRLSAVVAAMLALAMAPFVLVAALTYRMLLTEYDIYSRATRALA